MLRKIDSAGLGTSDLGWLRSRFHFSFAEYRNPESVHFGALRVLNDDLVAPGRGFAMHPHSDFEILSYVVEGTLTHGDSLGNQHSLTRGEVQYMSAGTGVLHSEYNRGDKTLRFLQMWIFPDEKGRAETGGCRSRPDPAARRRSRYTRTSRSPPWSWTRGASSASPSGRAGRPTCCRSRAARW
jgi:redox-sensitive bicupin YhaK (pirin superfamily)